MKKPIVFIAGLGLIGGSIALGIKKAHPEYEIVGYDFLDSYRKKALGLNLVDKVSDDFKYFAGLADIIILAMPIQQIKDSLLILSEMTLKEDVLITDVGSTKMEIVKLADKLFKDTGISFIGGHPMAGSHKSGPLAADVSLFENAYYILAPSSVTKEHHITLFKELLSGLQVRFIEIDALEHDLVTSQVSHFPHVLAASLMEQAGFYALHHPQTQNFAAGGFRDMTRIAESEPSMWTSILLSNKKAILDRITDFQNRLSTVYRFIEDENQQAIFEYFEKASDTRKKMTIHRRGGVDSSYDLFVDVPDKEDVILEILELLRGISLVNIHINEENREDIYGVLQLSFKTQKDQYYAYEVLKQQTAYTIKMK